jgi:hypothetical protein
VESSEGVGVVLGVEGNNPLNKELEESPDESSFGKEGISGVLVGEKEGAGFEIEGWIIDSSFSSDFGVEFPKEANKSATEESVLSSSLGSGVFDSSGFEKGPKREKTELSGGDGSDSTSLVSFTGGVLSSSSFGFANNPQFIPSPILLSNTPFPYLLP